jgi:hypothetical protein
MKNDKIILVSVIAWSVMAVVLATPAAATQNTLYFIPDSGSLPGYCESIDIDLMADINEANPVIAASVNITFDPNCVEITNWAGDTTVWTGGVTSTAAGSLPHGYLTITTARMGGVSGSLSIGTLTLHCNSTEDCETCLKFSSGDYYTTKEMETLYPTLNDGIFSCASPPASGDDGEQEGGGNSGGEITITPSPTHSPGPTASPIQDTTPTLTPTPTPAVSPTVTPVATSNPTPASSPEEMRTPASPGFGLIISVGMLVVAVYLIRKRGGR